MKAWPVLLSAAFLTAPAALADTLVVPAPEPVDLSEPGSVSTTEPPAWFQTFTLADPGFVTPEAAPEGFAQKDLRLQWLKTGRWELTLDLTSRSDNSPLPREEMEASATFQITPRISLGGDVSVGADELDDRTDWKEQDIEAGIKLRSAFRF